MLSENTLKIRQACSLLSKVGRHVRFQPHPVGLKPSPFRPRSFGSELYDLTLVLNTALVRTVLQEECQMGMSVGTTILLSCRNQDNGTEFQSNTLVLKPRSLNNEEPNVHNFTRTRPYTGHPLPRVLRERNISLGALAYLVYSGGRGKWTDNCKMYGRPFSQTNGVLHEI